MEDLLVIMVVEDDDAVQGVVEEALTDGGFEPAIAASGEEAVTLLKGLKGKYRALVADVNLRGRMNGWEVAKQAREIDPTFPIIYMTGERADQWASNGVPNSILLTKPFAPAQLVRLIVLQMSERAAGARAKPDNSTDVLMCREQFNERGVSTGGRVLHPAVGGYGVAEYRAYVVGRDDHFIGFQVLVCADDAEAIEKAKRLVDRYAIELWSGERFVTRLEHSAARSER